jgi:hypothetical protein
MNKIVVIHQPDFMPYLGFFHRFVHADLYIALDHVQFVHSSRSWTHRDKIKTAQGENWLTISVKKAPRDTPINQIKLSADVDWRQQNLNLLDQNYRKAPFYKELMPEVERLYGRPFELLRDFNIASIELIMNMLDVPVPWVWSSTLDPVGAKNELLINLLGKVSASHYLSGIGAREYLQPELFAKAGIEVIWQNFVHPIYAQQFENFVPYLSALDVLFNHGTNKSREILRGVR